ncbi:MAG TPA: hypothetical protein PK713_00480 [Candidatus Cloacimonas sp.]|nr:hypothetical protein [Candidatus Cloacimonas sp.]
MNKVFYRPLIIVVIAVILVELIARVIPDSDNKIFPIKKLSWLESIEPKDTIEPTDTIVVKEATAIPNNLLPLQPFIQKMNNSAKSIRIAYYGDSIIEGDLITGKLRQELQSVHSGSGVGMIGITSIVSGFRQTIKHKFSRNWESISFMSTGRNNIPLGITGYTYIPRNYYIAEKVIEPLQLDSLAVLDTSQVVSPKPHKESERFYVDYNPWVEYTATTTAGGAPNFKCIRLFYSHAADSSFVKVSYDGSPFVVRYLNNQSGVQMLDLSPAVSCKKVRLEFSAYDPLHIYGVSFDEPTGAYIDNYPIRGYSGMFFQRIRSDILSGFQKHLKYDLVILHYGVNVSNYQILDYSYYERGMKKSIAHIQKALPGVPILLISAHDRSIKQGSEYITSPDIPYLVATQSNVAKETGCGFWNLFAAMGGINSMPKYVNHKPPYAGKDYTHFTRAGADHIAEMLLIYLRGH